MVLHKFGMAYIYRQRKKAFKDLQGITHVLKPGEVLVSYLGNLL